MLSGGNGCHPRSDNSFAGEQRQGATLAAFARNLGRNGAQAGQEVTMDRRARYQGAPQKLDVVRRGRWTPPPLSWKARPPRAAAVAAEIERIAHTGAVNA